ncbi:polymorphic toxin-type HINT domain-containing protein [Actinoplanes sp. NPDC049265]|uniref:polymorphic toxin-type HINT domain-containing protein n=1 Tax=Actinoplanes sp. NPDC049265 TaxID=3363902 RepID=UPI0037196700
MDRPRRLLPALVTVLCALSFAVGSPASAKPAPPAPLSARTGPSVRGVKAAPTRFTRPIDAARNDYRPTATKPPAPAEAVVTLGAARAKAAGAPIWLQGGRGDAKLRLTDESSARRAGVTGQLIVVSPGRKDAGKTRVGLDYSGFAEAYGGNYGSRLRLVQLPACAATTPEAAACQTRTELASANDVAARTVSAEVSLTGATVLAAVADPKPDGGAAGTYAASDLKPTGSWAAGGSSGSFSYSYPIITPPAATAAVPKLSIGYDSGSIDGQTASTQAQSSWVGDGWGTPQSYIEQTFTSCRDKPEGTASPKATDDLCYAGPILTLSLNGTTTALVWDKDKDEWRPETDNGEVISRGPADFDNGSGANDKRYWQVTTQDGTIYQFGRNRLPGWSGTTGVTKSVDTVPVYSPHSTGPCYKSSGFDASFCTMARRWNLDYTTDVSGNATTYYYTQELNYYGRNLGTKDDFYVRDSFLDHIEYGFRDGAVVGTTPNRIEFGAVNRCAGTCGALSSSTKALYPDVPFDLVCNSGTDCTSFAPSFFSTKRLGSITTKQWNKTSQQLAIVDKFALDQSFPATDDGTSPSLWLKSIGRIGYAPPEKGASIELPKVTFTSIKLPNRVYTTSAYPSFYRHRVATITTETGSVIGTSYVLPEPCGATKPTPATNTKSCFPVRWSPAGVTEPIVDWFNKYAVDQVTASDPTGGAPATVTSYKFLGGAAWRYDDNEVIKAKFRTYGQFRGYGKVQTLSGNADEDRRTKSETTYYRGMSKNNNDTVVNVTDSLGGSHEDLDELAGSMLEDSNYRGEGGAVDSSTISAYWVSAATATRARAGLPALTANRMAPVLTHTRKAVTSGGSTTWRTTQVDNSYDDNVASPTFGVLEATYSHSVPVNAAYDQCTLNTYAPVNTAKNLVGLVSQTETLATACGGFTAGSPATEPGSLNKLAAPSSVSRPAQTISAARTFYDDPTWSTTFPQATAPTRGLASMVRQGADYVNGAYTWQTAARTTYDALGRPIDAYDANGNKTTTAYAMNAAGLPTGTTATNPAGHAISTTLEPSRGVKLTSTGPNGEVTTQAYDALGRTTDVWFNSRPTTSPANQTYSYVVSGTGLTTATTKILNNAGGYRDVRVLIYDAQLRPRQTQSSTPQSGRLITDTFYDSRGWVRATYNDWWDKDNSPSAAAIATSPTLGTQAYDQTFTTYNGLGDAVVVERANRLVTVEKTITIDSGDRVTVVPPEGATVTTAVTDPIGRTTAQLQYTARPAVTAPADLFTGTWTVSGGSTTSSRYGYDVRGNQNKIIDADGNEWTSEYDLLNRIMSKTDPDGGATIGLSYDATGNLLESTDSRGRTTSATYDALGRKTAAYASSTAQQSDANRTASWVYDNSDNALLELPYAKGRLTSSTAYRDGNAYRTQILGYDIGGGSTGEAITIPASEGALGGTYEFGQDYTSTTRLPHRQYYPGKGGLPEETATTLFDPFDRPAVFGGLNQYSGGVAYDEYGRVSSTLIGKDPDSGTLANLYDPHTGRLVQQELSHRDPSSVTVQHLDFTYDLAGNLKRQHTTRTAAGGAAETQCYGYDELLRLTEAWTGTDDCAAQPTADNRGMVGNTIGDGSAYWTSWSFDAIGNRAQQTEHNLTGGSDNTTTYAYDGNGKNQPHTLTSTTSTAPHPATSFGYDQAGNMTTRNAGTGPQTLTWDDSGQLTKVSGPAGDTTNVYDADGNLLIQRNPQETTLYLGSQQHVLNKSTGVVTGRRYLPLPGGGHVVRTASGSNYTFALTDGHDSPTLYLDGLVKNPTWRQYTPYGEPRGAQGAYPDNRGFLNQPENKATGLTRLGARDYDPVTGTFISLDPIQDKADPQQWQGYSYGNNNPVLFADPTGTVPITDEDGPGTTGVPGRHPSSGSGGSGSSGSSGGSSGSSGGGHAAQPQANNPGAQHSKPHRGFLGAFWDDVKGTVSGTWKLRNDFNACTLRWSREGCNNTWNTAKDQAVFSYEISQCSVVMGVLGDPLGGCGQASQKLGCEQGGPMADCAGHLTFFVASTVVTEGAGRFFKMPLKGAKPREAPAAPAASVAEDAASCAIPHSFAASTLVLMANGRTKPIGEVEVGDSVLATDPETGETTEREVTDYFTNHDTELTDLTVTSPSSTATLNTTQHHPFWSPTRKQWVDAADLKPGEQLSTVDRGTVLVARVRNFSGHRVMHDLTVAAVHTYYVVARDTPVLVHNCGGEATVHLDFSNMEAKHALITIRSDAGEVLSTEQVGSVAQPRAGVQKFDLESLDPSKSLSVNVRLPNAGGALAYAEVQMEKTARGTYPSYSLRNQSCLHYCANVLRAGGVEGIPTTMKGIENWLREQHG